MSVFCVSNSRIGHVLFSKCNKLKVRDRLQRVYQNKNKNMDNTSKAPNKINQESHELTLADTLAIKDATQNMRENHDPAPSTTSASSAGSNSKIKTIKLICLEEKGITKYPSDIIKKRQISHVKEEMMTNSKMTKKNNNNNNSNKLKTTTEDAQNSPSSSNFQRPVSPLILSDTDAEIQHLEQHKTYDLKLTKSSQQVQVTKLSPRGIVESKNNRKIAK